MKIEQWEDKNLSHFSYAVLNEAAKKIVLVDPARDPSAYLDYAEKHNAEIVAIIETHPHADFVSSHKELAAATGATIYVSGLVGAGYDHQAFDEGYSIQVDEIKMTSINTPGHSPDSICILLEEKGVKKAVFTGDTLFIGDCGRPDLREGAGNVKVSRRELASQMYHSLRNKLITLPGDVVVYPAHGAGTLCGKALSSAHSSTIAAEKLTNWSLQEQTEETFVKSLLEDQPFVPLYFPYDVELNRNGAPAFRESIVKVKRVAAITDSTAASELEKNIWIVDARDAAAFKKEFLPHSFNLMEGTKFETWLGSIIQPGEKFYLGADSEAQIDRLVKRAAAIGYEGNIESAFVIAFGEKSMEPLDVDQFKSHLNNYTVVDVRNTAEVQEEVIFPGSMAIPLAEVRQRAGEIPTDKPIVVHCAGGYRSAAASSLIKASLNGKATVYDLGESVKDFMKK